MISTIPERISNTITSFLMTFSFKTELLFHSKKYCCQHKRNQDHDLLKHCKCQDSSRCIQNNTDRIFHHKYHTDICLEFMSVSATLLT